MDKDTKETVWLQDMTWEEVKERLDQGLDTIILPWGSTEQHGPHLPLGTDTMVAVTLAEDGPGTTVLTYTAKADVGGKMAQLGSRLIQSTSKKLAGKFFSDFNDKLSG